jgi:hypothetical protein
MLRVLQGAGLPFCGVEELPVCASFDAKLCVVANLQEGLVGGWVDLAHGQLCTTCIGRDG